MNLYPQPYPCPKCGTALLPAIRWCGPGERQKWQKRVCQVGEHLHRSCSYCGWTEIVPCADAGVVPESTAPDPLEAL